MCDHCLAELAGGNLLPTYYDQQGFDSEGYDAEGYDRGGYDRYLFDRHGQDLLLPSDDDDDDYRDSDPSLYDDSDRYFGDRNRHD